MHILIVYGTTEVDPFEMTDDIQVSVYNRSERFLLDQDLSGHFERVAALFDRVEREGGFEPPARALRAMGTLADVAMVPVASRESTKARPRVQVSAMGPQAAGGQGGA